MGKGIKRILCIILSTVMTLAAAPVTAEASDIISDIPEMTDEGSLSENRIIPVYLKNGVKIEDIVLLTDQNRLEYVNEGSEYTGEPYNCKEGDYVIIYDDESSADTLYFKVRPDEGRAVRVNSEMKYPDESNPTGEVDIPDPDEDGYYEYNVSVFPDDTISVTIDQPEYRTVSFVTYHAAVLSYDTNMEFEDNRTRVREGDRLRLFVYPDDDYKIESVTAGDMEAVRDPDDESVFTFSSIDADTVVSIWAVPVDREIVFEVKQAGYTYEVDTDSEIRKSDDGDDKYLVSYRAEGIGFSVTPDAEETPAVYYVGHDSVVYKAEGIRKDDKYEYFIEWAGLPVASNVIITCDGGTFGQKITVTYPVGGDSDDAEFVESLILGTCDDTINTVSENIISAGAIYGDTVSENCISKTYFVNFGSTLKLTCMMADEYNGGFVCARRGSGKQISNFASRGSFIKSYPVIGDMDIEIYPVPRLRFKVKKEGISGYINESVTGISNTTFELEEGTYIGELYLGNTKIPANEYCKYVNTSLILFSGDDAVINIDPGTRGFVLKYNIGGKNGAIMNVIIDGKERYYKYSYNVNIKPVAKLTGITLKPLGQSTAESYDMCTDQILNFRLTADRQIKEPGSGNRPINNGRASLSMLECEVEYAGQKYPLENDAETVINDGTGNVVKVFYSTTRGRVTLTSDIRECDLTLNFYKNEADSTFSLLKSVPVRIKKDEKIQNTEPDVRIVRTSDSAIYLEFSDMDIQKPYLGKTYYKVEVTPKPGSIPENIIQEKKTFYIPRNYPVLVEYPEDYTEKEQEKIDRQNAGIKKDFRQQASVSVINDPMADGAEWRYEVKVSCVNTKPLEKLAHVDPSADERIHVESRERKIDTATLKPVYATRITLGKKKTSIFAGEKNVSAAVVGFDRDATCTTAEASDITSCPDALKLKAEYEPVRKELIVSSDRSTLPGKHTIKITPYGNGLHQEPVLFDITVYKSIDSIRITPTATEFVRPDKGALTIKTTVDLNVLSGIKPKSDKLTYSITDLTDMDGTEIDKESATYKLVSVKNGTVTVKAPEAGKNGTEEDDGEETVKEFRFRIRADASDYAGNEVYGESDIITIKSIPQELGTVMLLMYDKESHLYRKVADSSNDRENNVRTEDVQNALIAVAGDKTVKEKFYRCELSEFFIDPDSLSYMTSNKAALPISRASGNVCVSARKTAGNVKITVNTKDGGNRKAVLKLNIVYDEPYMIGAKIAGEDDSNHSFSGTSNTVIDVRLIKKDNEDEEWKDVKSSVNAKVSIKGGKIISKDTLANIYKVTVSKGKAELTVNDRNNNRSRTYVIENKSYENYKDKTVRVSAANTLLSCSDAEQTVGLELLPRGLELNGKYLYLAPDCGSVQKTPDNYMKLVNAIKPVEGSCIKTDNGCYVKITDTASTKAGAEIKITSGLPVYNFEMAAVCGTYKDGVFSPESVPARLKIKSVRPKQIKGSFKMNTVYKISAEPSAECKLTGKGKAIRSVEYKEIFNANINGRPNKFCDYFEFIPTDTHDPGSPVMAALKLKSGLTEEQLNHIQSRDGANDRIAYVSCTASYGDDGYGNPLTTVTEVVKIRVVFGR